MLLSISSQAELPDPGAAADMTLVMPMLNMPTAGVFSKSSLLTAPLCSNQHHQRIIP